MHKIAIVILNYNGYSYLEKFIPSFLKFSEGHPIYVVDNASIDDSLSLLKERFPSVNLISHTRNLGFTGGYNEALKQIEAQYYAIVNSDIEVTDGWLGPHIEFLDNHNDYAGTQPKIKNFQERAYFEYAGAAGGYIDRFGYPYCRGRLFNQLEEDKGQYDTTIDVSWTSGACMIINASAFNQVGGFDTDFFAHMEEIDLCWRLANQGYRMACIPESTVYHVGGGTLSSSNPFKTYLNFRNGLAILVKNLPYSQFWKIPTRIALDWLAFLKFLLEGNGVHSISILKAHFAFLKDLFKNLNKRSSQSTVNNKKAFLSRMSIVWLFYVRKRLSFDKLQ
ncbi:MAG: GT2 family glycosyltransferase [Cyclobacteriaceae bacterium]|jgi:GT2 family glycosyltransferase